MTGTSALSPAASPSNGGLSLAAKRSSAPRKILIVDDSPTNREFLVTTLGYAGHQLIEACNGEEGLARARSEHPDLIIADILMPTMDGYEFVHQLRADPAIAQTPVVFHTASYREHERGRSPRHAASHSSCKNPPAPTRFLPLLIRPWVSLGLTQSRQRTSIAHTCGWSRTSCPRSRRKSGVRP